MKEAIAAAALALLASAFALEGAFFLGLAVPDMGRAPIAGAGATASPAAPCTTGSPSDARGPTRAGRASGPRGF